MSSASSSFDSPAFHVRRLSHFSQKMFENKSYDAASPKSMLQSWDESQASGGLDKPSLQEDLKLHRRIACCHFIELFLFMLAFLTLIWLHEDIEQVFKLERVLDIELTRPFGSHSKTIRDVAEIKDVWEWMDDVLLPVMINHKDEVGHYLPREDWGYLAYYNRIIGGIKFEQTRSKSVKCEYDLDQFYGNCQPIHTHDHHSYGYPECEATNSTNTTTHTDDASSDSHNITACFNREDYEGAVDFYHDEGFTINKKDNVFEMWIDLIDNEENIWKRQTYLKDRHWLDRETKQFTIQIIIYNSQAEPLISQMVVHFEFTRVGYITPSIEVSSIALVPYFTHGILKGLLEVLYLLILLDRTFSLCKEIYVKVVDQKNNAIHNATGADEGGGGNQEHKQVVAYPVFSALKDHFWNEGGHNWLSLVHIAVGISLCIQWGLLVMNLRVVEDGLAHLHRPSGEVQYDDNDADVWSEYHHDISRIEQDIQHAINNMVMIRRFAVVIVFAMIFEFFKVLEGIPALKRVADTLNKAWSPLLSFALVLSVLVTLFAGAGMLAFGQKMEGFHTLFNSIVSTMIVVTTGSSEIYDEQFTISPLIASIWYWLLVSIMGLVCLRLMLCILMDAYGEASEAAEEELDHTTLLEQGYDTLKFLFYHHGNIAWEMCSGGGVIGDGGENNDSGHVDTISEVVEESNGKWF